MSWMSIDAPDDPWCSWMSWMSINAPSIDVQDDPWCSWMSWMSTDVQDDSGCLLMVKITLNVAGCFRFFDVYWCPQWPLMQLDVLDVYQCTVGENSHFSVTSQNIFSQSQKYFDTSIIYFLKNIWLQSNLQFSSKLEMSISFKWKVLENFFLHF